MFNKINSLTTQSRVSVTLLLVATTAFGEEQPAPGVPREAVGSPVPVEYVDPNAPDYFDGSEVQPLEFVVLARDRRSETIKVLGTTVKEVEVKYEVTIPADVDGPRTPTSIPRTEPVAKKVRHRQLRELSLPAWSLSRVAGGRVPPSSIPVGHTPAILLRKDSALAGYHRRLFRPETIVIVVVGQEACVVPTGEEGNTVPTP